MSYDKTSSKNYVKLGWVAAAFILLFLALWVGGNKIIYRSRADSSVGALDIRASDIRKDSLRLVYRTLAAEPSLVRYGEEGKFDRVASDISGPGNFTVHLVPVSFLQPGRTYTFQIGKTTFSASTAGTGQYTPQEAKIISGTLSSSADFADSAVVLQTKDKYFSTRPDKNGNWLITWVNNISAEGKLDIDHPIGPTNIIVYPREKSPYTLPIDWLDIRTISAGVVAQPAVKNEPKLSFLDEVKKFIFTFIPTF